MGEGVRAQETPATCNEGLEPLPFRSDSETSVRVLHDGLVAGWCKCVIYRSRLAGTVTGLECHSKRCGFKHLQPRIGLPDLNRRLLNDRFTPGVPHGAADPRSHGACHTKPIIQMVWLREGLPDFVCRNIKDVLLDNRPRLPTQVQFGLVKGAVDF
jgi:hypothetical protein